MTLIFVSGEEGLCFWINIKVVFSDPASPQAVLRNFASAFYAVFAFTSLWPIAFFKKKGIVSISRQYGTTAEICYVEKIVGLR